jgi:hypothetical protein
VFEVEVFEQDRRRSDAGVVEEQVKPSESRVDLREECYD